MRRITDEQRDVGIRDRDYRSIPKTEQTKEGGASRAKGSQVRKKV